MLVFQKGQSRFLLFFPYLLKESKNSIKFVVIPLTSEVTATTPNCPNPVVYFLNGPIPATFSFSFGLFQTIISTILTGEKCPFNIRCRDSNSQPLDNEIPSLFIFLLNDCSEMEYLHVVVDDKSRPKINEKEAGLAHLKIHLIFIEHTGMCSFTDQFQVTLFGNFPI